MNLAQILNQLAVTVDREDISGTYVDFVNQALVQIQDLHSWDEMKKTSVAGTILAGVTFLDLPADFKEFQNGRFPTIVDEATSGGRHNYAVYSVSEVEKLRPSLRPARHFVYEQRSGEVSRINLSEAKTEDLQVQAKYYAYLPELAEGDVTEHLLLSSYPNMVLSKTLSLVFQSLNDDQFIVHERAFANEFKNNSGKDIKVSYPTPRAEKE